MRTLMLDCYTEYIYQLTSVTTFPRDVSPNTGFYPVHIHSNHPSILNYVPYNKLSVSLFTFYNIPDSSQFFTNFSTLHSHLHLISYKNLPKFSNYKMLVFLINFLYAISQFICGHFLLKKCSLHFSSLCIPEVGLYVIRPLPPHIKNIYLFLLLSTEFSVSKFLV